MKEFRKTGPTTLRRVIGNLLTQRRILAVLAVAAGLLPASNAVGTEINLVTGTAGAVTSGSFPGTVDPTFPGPGGSGAIYGLIDTKPAGTGVFRPFLSYQAKGTEEGVNTSLGGNGQQAFLDDKRVPQWNHDLRLGELGVITQGGVNYYAFELDANETGNGNDNRLLSIDDIRIYTSAASPFADLSNDAVSGKIQADTLGDLRYAQNAGTTDRTTANWVLIDSSSATEGSTSGSGSSDMRLLVRTDLFPDQAANKDLFVTFYTLNGVHNEAGDDGSNAGFEEWSAFVSVPDGSSTLLLLGAALIPLGLLRARREMMLSKA